MEKTYSVSVNGDYNFEFTDADLASLDALELSDGKIHVLQEAKSFTTEIIGSDLIRKRYSVKLGANHYDVRISNELDLLINEMGLSAKVSNAIKDIKAPMPGLILEVNVVPGQKVKEGDYLLVLEAMKMENTLSAPKDGVVKSVTIEKGDTVDKNQLLVEME